MTNQATLTTDRPRCVCAEMGATGPGQRHALCPAHADEDAELDAQHRAEMAAENAWLRAAEYDARMDDPREW